MNWIILGLVLLAVAACIEWIEILFAYQIWGLDESEKRYLRYQAIPDDTNPRAEYQRHLLLTWAAAIVSTVAFFAFLIVVIC